MSIASFLSGRGQRLSRHMQNRLSTWRAAYERAQTRYARPTLFDPLEPRMLLSGTYTYVDLAGYSVTATLTGAGSIEVNNAGTDHTSINFNGTNTGSVLRFTVLNGTVKATTNIASFGFISGTLGSLIAGNVNITGSGISGGSDNYINNITLGNIANSASVSLAGIGRSATNITAGTVGDSVMVDIAQGISTAKFTSFGDGKIQSKFISKLNATGDFNADMTLSDTDHPARVVLGSATIGGNAANVHWTFTGSANYITVAGKLTAPDISISGNLYQLSAGSIAKNVDTDTAFHLYVTGQISKLKVTGSMTDGTLYANIIGSISIGGDFTNVGTTVGQNVAKTNVVALNSLTVGGTFDSAGSSSIWAANGSINSVKAAHVTQARIQIDHGRLASLTITGTGSSNIRITAGTVGNIVSAGDLAGDLILGADVTADNVVVLNQLKLTGSFTGNITTDTNKGSINTLSAASFAMNQLLVTGSISKITTTGDFTGTGGSPAVTASIIGTWIVGGKLSGLAVNIGTGTEYTSRSALGTLKVTGNIDTVTIASTFGGAGTISAAASANSTYDFHNGNVGSLIFTGTQSGGEVKAQSINNWTVGGDLSNLAATLATNQKLHGHNALQKLAVTGQINTVTINAQYGSAGSITGGSMDGGTYNFADGRINTLTSKGNQKNGGVAAQSIGNWTVSGNLTGLPEVKLGADTKLHGYYVLNSLNVTGAITDITISAQNGGVNSIVAGSSSNSSFLFADGRMASLTVKGAQTGGTINAMSLGTWSVGTDLTGATAALATSSTMHGYQALAKLTVGGTMSTTSITATYGGLGSYKIGTMGNGNTLSFADGRIEKFVFTNDINSLTLTAASMGVFNVTGNLVDSTITLTGAANKNAIDTFTVSGAMNGSTLTTPNGGLKYVTVGSMSGGSISAAKGRIETLTVNGTMTTADTSTDQLTAWSIGTWTVKGDLTNTAATFGAVDGKNYYALGNLSVTGAISGVDFSSTEDAASSISAASITGSTFDFAASAIESITTTGDMTTSTVKAAFMTNWDVKGNLTGVTATLGDSSTAGKYYALGSSTTKTGLTVGNTISNSTINVTGSIYGVTADKLQGSTIYAGYTEGSGTFSSNDQITTLNITGTGSYDSTTFTNNKIAAQQIGTLTATYPDTGAVSSITSKYIATLATTQYVSGANVPHTYTGLASTPTDTGAAGYLAGLSFTWPA